MIQHIKKLNLMMIMCCASQFIQAADLCSKADATNVIRCVIEIENKKSEKEKLWDAYFYNYSIAVNSVYVNGKYITVYHTMPLRKPYTSDADVAEYQRIEDEFNTSIQVIIENIKFMVSNGADLAVQDEFGKTAVDYCSIQEIYQVLRDLGAPFSLKAWFYFNENEATLISAVSIMAVAFGIGLTAGYIESLYR